MKGDNARAYTIKVTHTHCCMNRRFQRLILFLSSFGASGPLQMYLILLGNFNGTGYKPKIVLLEDILH